MNPKDLPPALQSSLPATRLGPAAAPDVAPARMLLDNAQTGLYVVCAGRIGYANPVAAALVGWDVAGLVGQPHQVMLAAEFRGRADAQLQRLLAGRASAPGDVRCQRRDGSSFDVRAYARRISFEGEPAVLVTLLDISELKEALRSAQWNASLMARTEALCSAGSFEIALPGGAVRMSAGLLALVGQAANTATQAQVDAQVGAQVDAQVDALDWVPAEEQAYVAGIWRNAAPGESFEFQHRVQRSDGQRLVVLHRGQLDAAGCGVALLQDITSRVEAEQRIQDLATHHEVTGLPNRAWLLDQIDAAMHIARWDGRRLALLAIDMPRIAEIKASMGFGAGDTMCMALAARLSGACGPHELVAHLGDTEFALLLESADNFGAGTGTDQDANAEPAGLRARALGLQQQLQAPVRLGTTDVHALCSIGIAVFPGHGEGPAGLLESAQTARLDVTHGAGVAFFRPETTSRAVRAMQIESALWRALENQELALHYQPQVDLGSGEICGAEALLRWQSPELGAVGPAEFIPVAERSGLIGAISDWVLHEACAQVVAWRRQGLPALRVNVNLAAAQLQRTDFAQHLASVLAQAGAPASSLGIEMTESMVMTDVQAAAATLRSVKAMGVQVSLDDFGTGYSSLSSLSQLPVDVVKVDRSFVCDINAQPQDVSVTRAIIHMTHGLQMRALAEGVETEGQLSLLVAAGCDEIQGWWFSKALPADEFAALLRSGKRLPDRYVRRPPGQRQRTLLLVDDEDNILSALKRLLRRDGYRILTAPDAAAGLQCLAVEEVDVIVSDQRMPGMTGVEFLRRAKDLYPHTLRMVLSGYTELQSIIDAVNEGAIYKFLTKPWDDELLRGHVAEAFRQKDLADENRRLARQVDQANADLAALNERLESSLGQQREQAQLLAASSGSLREMFEDMPLPLLGVDAEGLLAYANRQAESLLPTVCARLGLSVAAELPAAVLAPLGANGANGENGENGATALRASVGGCDFEVRVQAMAGASGAAGTSGPRGRVLVFLPLGPAVPAAQMAASAEIADSVERCP